MAAKSKKRENWDITALRKKRSAGESNRQSCPFSVLSISTRTTATSGNGVVTELTGIVRDGRARILGLIRQEILTGVRTDAQFEELRKTLRASPDEPVDMADYEAAAKAANQCRGEGITASTVDALICAVAQRRGLAIFTTDPDFSTYARVLPLTLHAAVQSAT